MLARAVPTIDRIVSTLTNVREGARRYRLALTVAAGLLFVGGLAWSVSALHLEWDQISLGPILLLIFVMGPLGVAYGAVGLILLGSAAGTELSMKTALRVDAYGQLAEALPLPGGAIVRAGALMRAGVRPQDSAILVLASAVLWIAIAAFAAGIVLLTIIAPAGALLSFIGASVSLLVLAWLIRTANWRLGTWMLLHRTIGLLINAIRLKFAFAALYVVLPLASTLPFALATIVGSASSVAPAGLGISESLSALMAHSLGVAGPAAFIAVALNRLSALLATGLIVAVIEIAGHPKRGGRG
jgi:hypothetical protein